jgi:pyruvate/2-oxoglutarate dehydrogenase complex dihydrolipoamide acyltransferase (E2) component
VKKYKEIKYPRTRIATLDVCDLGNEKHHMKALLELDVTETRKLIKKNRNIKKCQISFIGWLIKTISETINEHQKVHAYLKSKKSAVIFEDIDISITIEKEYDGELVPLPYIIRKTNQKSFAEISKEIIEAKNQNMSSEDIVLGQKKNKIITDLYYFLPGFLRRYVWKFILKHPSVAKNAMGSVMVTSIGMVGKINGWFIYTSIHPLSFGISSIVKKPLVINDKIEIREIMNLTVLLDHDVIDGVPMAKFIKKLSENVETGLGLN